MVQVLYHLERIVTACCLALAIGVAAHYVVVVHCPLRLPVWKSFGTNIVGVFLGNFYCYDYLHQVIAYLADVIKRGNWY